MKQQDYGVTGVRVRKPYYIESFLIKYSLSLSLSMALQLELTQGQILSVVSRAARVKPHFINWSI